MLGTALSGGCLRLGWEVLGNWKKTLGVGEFSRSSNHSQSPTPPKIFYVFAKKQGQ